PQTVTLTNTSPGTTLNIGSITIAGIHIGDFTKTTTCTATLGPGASCTITVTFSPEVGGPRSATVSISDSDPTSPQIVTLAGTGTSVRLAPPKLDFGTQKVGTTSSPQSVTLTDVGTTTITFSPFVVVGANPGDFSMTTTCAQNLFAGKSCTISVTFSPTVTGARNATVQISDDAGGSPQTVPLTGVGN
ncbi:MAG TPA: choice-of-anchor D domain-containing protein, partial [Terriglobales bacterium]|nr:choice-of-anchor D domain-containing protein [Terriglobales bacterium]